jgi:MFS family permease
MPQTQSLALFEKNPIFRYFISATTVSLLGTNIFDWSIPVYVSHKTGSVGALAMATICLTLPFILMAPLTGFIVDNFNKRKVMLCADIGQVICMLFILIYALSGIESLWPLFVAVFLAKSLMITFETVATFQLIPSLVEQQELAEANTWFLSAQRLIQILGPLAAGAFMSAFGFESCVVLNLMSFGATLYFVLSMKNLNELISSGGKEQKCESLTLRNVVASFRESTGYIWKSPLFRPFVLMMFVWNLSSLMPGTPTIVHYFMQEMKFTSVQYGVVTSLVGVIGIVGFILAGAIYRRYKFQRAFVGSGAWLAGFSTMSVLFLSHPLIMAVLFATSKAGSSVLSMGTFVLRQMNIPYAKMGGVNASLRMFFMSSAPISAGIQGIIIARYGVGTSFAIGAVCLWITMWYALRVAKAYEKCAEKWALGEAA